MSNIRPCWWGSHLWQTTYYLVAVYPEIPTPEEIECIKGYFKCLKHFLPCEGCKKSYCKFADEHDTRIDNPENFKTRNKLIEFVYNLRQKVNVKLSHEYNINLNYFKKKLDNMIINESNNNDGKVCEMIEAPFVPVCLEKKVLQYLKSNSFDHQYTKKLLEVAKDFMKNPVFDFDNKQFKFLYKRHKKCRNIINEINHNMIEGNYDLIDSFRKLDKNLHLKLLFYGCTMIHKENLEKLIG